MKTVLTLLMLFLTFNSFCQEKSEKKSADKPYYSENSELKVFYTDKSRGFHPDQKPVGVFVNDKFIGSQEVSNFINKYNIENITIKKEKFERNGTEYYGKVFIQMRSNYHPNFLTLKELSTKYLELNENPIIYQIDEKVIENSDEILVDENHILKIVVQKVKASEKNIEINLIKLITKTPENIKKANEIRLKGSENIKTVANK